MTMTKIESCLQKTLCTAVCSAFEVLAAYPPEQREQLVNQYKQWSPTSSNGAHLAGESAYTSSGLSKRNHAVDFDKLNVINRESGMYFLCGVGLNCFFCDDFLLTFF